MKFGRFRRELDTIISFIIMNIVGIRFRESGKPSGKRNYLGFKDVEIFLPKWKRTIYSLSECPDIDPPGGMAPQHWSDRIKV